MQAVQLGGLKRGIDRTQYRGQQVNGGALYDLVNAYLTIAGTVQRRPPFRKVAQLDPATRGLFANNARLHTFYSGAGLASPLPGLIAYHPLPLPNDVATALVRVTFDALYLGRQFVITRWDDGSHWNYWLPSDGMLGSSPPWQPNHQYNVTDTVQPTVPNGLTYAIGNQSDLQAWQPTTGYKLGDVVVPTTLNGWKYTVIEADGDTPSSGATEPAWPEQDGATVSEDRDNTGAPPTQPPSVPPTNPGGGRYSNPGGGGGSNGAISIKVL